MLSVFANAFRTPDVRRKLLFVLGMLAIYRFGAVLPTPGIDYNAVQQCVALVQDNTLYSLINLFSGGALLQLSIFALGVMPYITASIILQLLTIVIPRLETLKKEGQSGQAVITQYTRYVTIGLAILQATSIVALARTPGALLQGCDLALIPDTSIPILLVMVIVLTAGTAVVMWLGELITDRGIGNGMSLLIMTSIISTLPGQMWGIFRGNGVFAFSIVLVVGVFMILVVAFVEQGQRRIPVQYAKRMVGRRAYGGTSTYLPMKVNMAGVIPVIFASSLLYVPVLFTQLSGSTAGWAQFISRSFSSSTSFTYAATYGLLIFFFAFFYVSITFNPDDVADDMKKYGGFVPGIRAGKPTADYLRFVLNRLLTAGALYLLVVAIVPYAVFGAMGIGAQLAFGGTSLLIMVGVGLDTVKQIEAQLQQRNYEGFLG
ncbi:MAG: preprotein translocase subunit SecY [actinobacterium acAMD-5]|jgi:preprotein translocase subunit SecY|nr:MAG: preprotein translocase subunit SecY [actinobacterium acAMD-5]